MYEDDDERVWRCGREPPWIEDRRLASGEAGVEVAGER